MTITLIIIQFLKTIVKIYGSLCRQISKYLNKINTSITTPSNLSYFIDVFDENHISGWIWNPKSPSKPVSLDFFDNDHKLTRIKADKFRHDLLTTNIGNGKHAFDYIFPESIKNNWFHKISLSSNQNIILSSYIYFPVDNFIRKYLSKKYIKGTGIEIGALHNPLWVSPQAKVKYVDRFDKNLNQYLSGFG